MNTRPNKLLISPVPGMTEIAEPTTLVILEEEKVPPPAPLLLLCVLNMECRFGDVVVTGPLIWVPAYGVNAVAVFLATI